MYHVRIQLCVFWRTALHNIQTKKYKTDTIQSIKILKKYVTYVEENTNILYNNHCTSRSVLYTRKNFMILMSI